MMRMAAGVQLLTTTWCGDYGVGTSESGNFAAFPLLIMHDHTWPPGLQD